MDATKLRITIWQPYFAERMLAYAGADATELGILAENAELQREVFTWPVEEDIWAGVTDNARRAALEQRLATEFQPERQPSERSMARFAELVAAIGELARSDGNDWSAGSSGAAEASSTTAMIDTLSAFHLQASWMLDVFRDLPGASVSVR